MRYIRSTYAFLFFIFLSVYHLSSHHLVMYMPDGLCFVLYNDLVAYLWTFMWLCDIGHFNWAHLSFSISAFFLITAFWSNNETTETFFFLFWRTFQLSISHIDLLSFQFYPADTANYDIGNIKKGRLDYKMCAKQKAKSTQKIFSLKSIDENHKMAPIGTATQTQLWRESFSQLPA